MKDIFFPIHEVGGEEEDSERAENEQQSDVGHHVKDIHRAAGGACSPRAAWGINENNGAPYETCDDKRNDEHDCTGAVRTTARHVDDAQQAEKGDDGGHAAEAANVVAAVEACLLRSVIREVGVIMAVVQSDGDVHKKDNDESSKDKRAERVTGEIRKSHRKRTQSAREKPGYC